MPTRLVTARPVDGPVLSRNRPSPLPTGSVFTQDNHRPGAQDSLLAGVIDMLSDGIVLTDSAGTVLYANRSARHFMSSGALAIRGGLLCASVVHDTQKLRALIGEAFRACGTSTHMRLGAHLFVTITAVGTAVGHADRDRAAVLLFRDLAAVHGPSPQSMGAYFGLTPAEARLASEIVEGDGLARCARRLGTKLTTVRSHLKHIFEKTETKRQAHLVRVLLSCNAFVTESPMMLDDSSDTGQSRTSPPGGR